MSAFHRYALILPVLTLCMAPAASAQSSGSSGYFMPPSAQKQSAPAPAAAPSVAPAAPAKAAVQAPNARPPESQIPQLPALPAEPAPPTPVIGVLSVPDVMQKSTAAQGVQAEIQKRQGVLKKEEEAAQAQLQSEQQEILSERGKISDSAFEAKVKNWQSEVSAAQSKFQDKNQAIQNAGQAALGQIEAELIAIIRQEAVAHGMNLILHREQVVLNVAGFDITDETVKQLNKLLPSVTVPPTVVTPGMGASQAGQDQAPGQ